jgi:hypothetical protein
MHPVEQQPPRSIEKDTAIAALKQLRPQSSSTERTARLMAPWVRCSSSAARLKLSSRAAASKQRKATSEGIRGGLPAEICESESLFS